MRNTDTQRRMTDVCASQHEIGGGVAAVVTAAVSLAEGSPTTACANYDAAVGLL